MTNGEIKFFSEHESSFPLCPWSYSVSNSCLILYWFFMETFILIEDGFDSFYGTMILPCGSLTHRFCWPVRKILQLFLVFTRFRVLMQFTILLAACCCLMYIPNVSNESRPINVWSLFSTITEGASLLLQLLISTSAFRVSSVSTGSFEKFFTFCFFSDARFALHLSIMGVANFLWLLKTLLWVK